MQKRKEAHAMEGYRLGDFYRAWLLGLLASVCYIARFFIELPIDKLGGAGESFLGRLRLFLLFFFLLLYIASLLYRLMLNLSDKPLSLSKGVELQKQRQQYLKRSIASILSLFCVLVFLNYISYIRNPALDLSPGYYSFRENSRTLIRSLEREVDVYAFLPEIQAIQTRRGGFSSPELYKITSDVRILLEQLASINSKVKIKFYNADIDSYDSNEFGNINNGTLVFRCLKQETHSLSLEEKPYVERKVYVNNVDDLKKMEKKVLKALIYVASPPKKVYFTVSNGERYDISGAPSRTRGLESLKQQLRFYNIKLEKLDSKSAWPGKALPKDADAVAILGPLVPFGKEARSRIQSYLQKGGALFLAIDAQAGKENFDWLLALMGKGERDKNYRFIPYILTNTNFSGLLISDNFEKHSITDSIKKLSGASVLMPQQAYFEERKEKKAKKSPSALETKTTKDEKKEGKKKTPRKKAPIKNLGELAPQILLYSPYNSYVDTNKNRRKDATEKAGRRILALAYEKKDFPASPKVVIFSGIDWLSERGIRYPVAKQNSLFATDSMLWLLESPLAATFTPLERPRHNVQVTDELKWRLILIGMFLFPIGVALALGGSLIYHRRKSGNPPI